MQGNGRITMSIRSNGELDASKVAELLCRTLGIKGGGHETSAAVHFKSLKQFSESIELCSHDQMKESIKEGSGHSIISPATIAPTVENKKIIR